MPETKNLCAQIPLELYAKVSEAREAAGLTDSEYVASLLDEYFEMKRNGGNTTMTGNSRTMAFQIPEELFQRIKSHLEQENPHLGRKFTQREFVLGLIEEALTDARQTVAEENPSDIEQPDETDAFEEEELPPEKD